MRKILTVTDESSGINEIMHGECLEEYLTHIKGLCIINGGSRILICNCNVVYRNIKRIHSVTEDLIG